MSELDKNEFSKFQKEFYTAETPTMKIVNHTQHNNNPNYWEILLGDVRSDPEAWKGKSALDFGCGCGRNLLNMSSLASWNNVDGVDISRPNIIETAEFMKKNAPDIKINVFENAGTDLANIVSDSYDFVMSTIVFQHIPVYKIRRSLKKEIFRVMKSGGLFSFQMGAGGRASQPWAKFKDDAVDVKTTNGGHDVSVIDPEELVVELKDIGFVDVWYKITEPFDDTHHSWIWVKARKP